MKQPEITLEQVEQFVLMLTGNELPDGVHMQDQPRLTPHQAFSVVWYLQEELGVIPGRYEQCSTCGELFDSECGGHIIDSNAEPDEWQRELGVTAEMVARAEGFFCCEQCEAQYWNGFEVAE